MVAKDAEHFPTIAKFANLPLIPATLIPAEKVFSTEKKLLGP